MTEEWINGLCVCMYVCMHVCMYIVICTISTPLSVSLFVIILTNYSDLIHPMCNSGMTHQYPTQA